MPLSFRAFVSFLVLLLLTTLAFAEPPSLEGLYPAGGQVGTDFDVKVNGKGLDKNNPVGWCSNPAVTLQPVLLTGDKAKDKTLAGLWHLTIAKGATPGPCLIRFHTHEGSSPPRIFEVGTAAEYSEQEPNDSLKESFSSSSSYSSSRKDPPPSPTPPSSSLPTPLSPPLTLNGLFAKEGDADTFPIRVRKGTPLTFELHGYSLGSSMDPAMRLLDERGIELASSHDTHNLDPLIHHTPTADTTLHVQIYAFVHPPQSDIAFKGTANHIYRLHITEASQQSSSSYSSSSSPKAPPASPTTTAPPASPIPLPLRLTATLHTPGQESAHLIQAKKGDDLQITVRAKALRSPLEAVLRIESVAANGETKLLQQNDDASGIKEAGSFTALDPALRWKAPVDGNYRTVVADRFQNGSPDHHYELSVAPWQPSVTATLAEHAFVLQPGKATDVKVAINLDGPFPHKLIARATHLPPGITCPDVELPTKSGELKLTLKAAPDAPAAQTPITIAIVPGTPSPSQAPANAPASSSNSNSSSTPMPPATPTALASTPSSSSSYSSSSSLSGSGAASTPLALATYPIPFKDLRGDLLLPTDTQIWLTVPQTAKNKAGK